MVFSCNIEHEAVAIGLGGHDLLVSKAHSCAFGPRTPRNGVHRHACYEVCLALEGSGTFLCGTAAHAIEPGAVFIVSPQVDHEIVSREPDWLKLHFFTFSLSPCRAGGGPWTEEDGLLERFLRHHRTVAPRRGYLGAHVEFQRQYLQAGGTDALRAMCLALVLDCIRALADTPANLAADVAGGAPDGAPDGASGGAPDGAPDGAAGGPDRPPQARALRPTHPLASRLDAYIRDHLQSRIALVDLCRLSRLSERSLYLFFEAHFGMPPARYITHCRIQASIGYLHMGFPVSAVADLMGFGDLSSFSRTFRRMTGRSPRQHLSERQEALLSPGSRWRPAGPGSPGSAPGRTWAGDRRYRGR